MGKLRLLSPKANLALLSVLSLMLVSFVVFTYHAGTILPVYAANPSIKAQLITQAGLTHYSFTSRELASDALPLQPFQTVLYEQSSVVASYFPSPTPTPMPTATPTPTPIPTVTPTPVPVVPSTTAPGDGTGTNYTAPGSTLHADVLFAMANDHRKSIGLPPFVTDANVCSIAASRAPELDNEVFGSSYIHAGFQARHFPYWITENMISYPTEAESFQWWMNSYIHRKALESSNKYACVACAGRSCTMLFTSYIPK